MPQISNIIISEITQNSAKIIFSIQFDSGDTSSKYSVGVAPSREVGGGAPYGDTHSLIFFSTPAFSYLDGNSDSNYPSATILAPFSSEYVFEHVHGDLDANSSFAFKIVVSDDLNVVRSTVWSSLFNTSPLPNTGYKGWQTLEEYYVGSGMATGNTKPNDSEDPDYVAPTYDTITCPLP